MPVQIVEHEREALLLCLDAGGIGKLNELVHVLAVVRADGNSYEAFNGDDRIAVSVRHADAVCDLLGRHAGAGRSIYTGEQYREVRAVKSEYEVRGTNALRHPVCRVLEYQIADVVSARLIDLLETLESDEHESERAVVRLPAQLVQLYSQHFLE